MTATGELGKKRKKTKRLTNNPANDIEPAWSPDGTKIAFTQRPDGIDFEIYVMNADGSDLANIPPTSRRPLSRLVARRHQARLRQRPRRRLAKST